ncbi:hypothetical protein [Paenibacillus elgii]|uniref:hypothetical protein n=1 Tax=Paenibacillus elgii TaxID=189691 RepID=UPI00203D6550|nr:hypothetical protein [Paenibacillus elgii]MCM3270865.1 hypothetical protein [Paenibacillus elgii]
MSSIDENYIIVFNRCFKFDEGKLSPLELYVYCYLYRSRLNYYDLGWITFTNIVLISSMLKCKIEGKGRTKLATIKSVLLNLKSKGYIFSDITTEKENDSLIKITFPTPESSGGYFQLLYTTFDLITDREHLYIFSYLEANYHTEYKRHYKNKLSYSDWANLLEVNSKNTAKSRLDSLNNSNSNPRIWKISGDFVSGTEKQQYNTYFTRADEKTILKWNNFYNEDGSPKYKKKKLLGTDIIYSPFEGELTVDEFEEVIEQTAWGKVSDYFSDNWNPEGQYQKIEIEDYYIYKTCKEYGIYPKFIEKCEYIIKAKKGTFNYNNCFEEWDLKYCEEDQTKIVNEINELRRKEAMSRYGYLSEYESEDDRPF